MIRPVSMAVPRVAFRGGETGVDKTVDAVDKAQKALQTMSNLTEGADEFKKNMKTYSDAYSDAVTDTLTKAAEENKALKPLAEAANSKAGKTVADVFGKFTAFCTNLASAATTVSTITK